MAEPFFYPIGGGEGREKRLGQWTVSYDEVPPPMQPKDVYYIEHGGRVEVSG